MKKSGALIMTLLIMGLMTLVSSVTVFGQENKQDNKPDAATERKAYDTLQATIAEKDLNKKMTMAREALGLYPNSQYVIYFKGQINEARNTLFDQARKENKPAEAFKIGGEVLKEEPENLNYLLTLADYSVNLAKKDKDFSYADRGTEYSKKAIELINGNKRPAGVEEAKWTQTRPTLLAKLHQDIGFFLLKANKNDEALTSFTESAKLNCSDPFTHYFVALVHKNRYEALSNEYRQMPDDQKTSDTGKALLEKINPVIDQIIESYGKMWAVSEGKTAYDALRNALKQDFEEFYKYRHEGKIDGHEDYFYKNLRALRALPRSICSVLRTTFGICQDLS
jgi:hypothetical protein